MPAKVVKTSSGRLIEMYSIRLSNGNLLVTKKLPDGTYGWVEAAPGTPDYKRWMPVAENRPDPRTKHGHEQTP